MKCFFAFLITIFLASLVFGQSVKFTGNIYDPTGGLVVKAQINAKNAQGKSVVGFTNLDGVFNLDLLPGIYALEISAPGFLTIKYNEYLVVNSPNGKMSMDFVMFGSRHHEPCGYSGGDCLPPNLLIKSYEVNYSPKLSKIKSDFAREQKQRK